MNGTTSEPLRNERRKTNRDLELVPVTAEASRVLPFDFPQMLVGSAEYREGPTGCTLFRFDKYASCAVDLRGGSSCALLIDGWETGDALVDGICFAGGSCCGVEAIGGAITTLFEARADGAAFNRLPRMMGAVIYDFRPRANSVYPDGRLGKYALEHAVAGTFALGAHGAGSSASVGKGPQYDLWERAGQGAAFAKRSRFAVGVFTVVNAVGAIIDRSGKTARGHYDAKSGKHLSYTEVAARAQTAESAQPEGNTTPTLLVTDLKLSPYQLRQLARSVHSSMARAIHPFHSQNDGDIFFAVSTQRMESTATDCAELTAVASELAWDAVLSSFDRV
jgi:6-aminohexanoate-oligomer endohydrolase